MTFRFTPLCALVALFVSIAGAAWADSLSGAWTMTKYEGPATHGTASGLLVFLVINLIISLSGRVMLLGIAKLIGTA